MRALCSRNQRVTKIIELRHRARYASETSDNEDDHLSGDDDQTEADIPLNFPVESPSKQQDVLQQLLDSSSDADDMPLDDDDDDGELENYEAVKER